MVDDVLRWTYRTRAIYTILLLLHISQESRAEAKIMYHDAFATQLPHPGAFSCCLDNLLVDLLDGAATPNTLMNSPGMQGDELRQNCGP